MSNEFKVGDIVRLKTEHHKKLKNRDIERYEVMAVSTSTVTGKAILKLGNFYKPWIYASYFEVAEATVVSTRFELDAVTQ